MFRRVLTEDWAHVLPFVGFFLFFLVFLFITACALRLGRHSRTRLARLPFDSGKGDSTTNHPPSP